MIIADENVERYWIELLRNSGFNVFSVKESYPGIKDLELIGLVKQKQGVLLTEDKDFGELVFAYSIKNFSVIFLRYDQPKYDLIQDKLLDVVEKFYESEETFFITITKNKIRIRKI